MIDASLALGFVLRLVRPGALVLAAPTIGGAHLPQLVKVGVTVALAVVLMPASVVPQPLTAAHLPAAILREMAVGLAIAMATRIVVGAAEVAGSMAGVQIGFGYAMLIDPQSGAQNSVLATLYGLMATVLLFAGNVHHLVIQALASSYEALPIGAGGVDASLVPAVGGVLVVIFAVGVQMAGPVLVVLLVTDGALGLLTRSVPSLNIMSMGFGIKLLAGLFVLAQTALMLPEVVERAARIGLDAAMRLARAVG